MMKLPDHRLDIRKVLSSPPPLLDHVLPGLLAGTVGALVAPGAAGKTMLLTQVACDIAAGAPVGGGIFPIAFNNPTGARVVLFLAEESQEVMHHRLLAALENMSQMAEFRQQSACDALAERLNENLHLYPLAGTERLLCVNGGESITADFRQMEVACKDARLVIVDPLRRFHSGEENDSSHMTAVVNAFERITRETGAAVILAHHANQSSVLNGAGAQASAARGSSALSAGVRWQANLSAITDQLAVRYRIPESDRHLFVRLDTPKVNYVSTGEPTILRKNPASGALAVWKPALTIARRSSVRQTVSKVGSQTLGAGR